MVIYQLQVERRTGKVRQSETDVLPLCYAANQAHYGTLIGSHTLSVKRNRRRATPMNGSVRDIGACRPRARRNSRTSVVGARVSPEGKESLWKKEFVESTIVVRRSEGKCRRGEEIRWGRLKMRDLMLTYDGILGSISCNKTAQIVAKTSSSLQLSV